MFANTVNRNLVRVVLFVGVILTIVSCKKEEIVDPPAQLITPFSGITTTDSTGRIIASVDSIDWKSISVGSKHYILRPAYPNPCSVGRGFVFQWYQQSRDSVVITLNDSPSHVLATLVAARLDSGNYEVMNEVIGFQPAIYRLFFQIVKTDSTHITYGDIQVN